MGASYFKERGIKGTQTFDNIREHHSMIVKNVNQSAEKNNGKGSNQKDFFDKNENLSLEQIKPIKKFKLKKGTLKQSGGDLSHVVDGPPDPKSALKTTIQTPPRKKEINVENSNPDSPEV